MKTESPTKGKLQSTNILIGLHVLIFLCEEVGRQPWVPLLRPTHPVSAGLELTSRLGPMATCLCLLSTQIIKCATKPKFLALVLGIQLRSSWLQGKHFATESSPWPNTWISNITS